MTTTRRTALLSGIAAITGAFVPRLFRRGLPAPSFAVTRTITYNFSSVKLLIGGRRPEEAEAFARAIRVGQLAALRPDGTVGPA